MIKNMKIKTRLLTAFSLMIALSFIIALIGLLGIRGAQLRLEEFATRQTLSDDAIKMCRIEANNAARTIRDMYIERDTGNYQGYEAKVRESITALGSQISILEENYQEKDGLVQKYEEAVNQWISIGLRAVDGLKTGKRDEVQEILLSECSPALDYMVSVARELTQSTERMKNALLENNRSSAQSASAIILSAAAISLLFGIVIALKITVGIVKPVSQMENAAQRMSNGILNADITYESQDAVGRMADSMRKSMATISGYIRDIDRAMEELAKGNFNVRPSQTFIGDFKHIEDSINTFIINMSNTLAELCQVSEQVSAGSGQVSDGAQALAQGAAEQASAVEQLAANMNDISTDIKKNADSAKLASQFVAATGQALENSNAQMKEMIGAMREISSSSSEIGKIIKTIEDIAFQTNILALNAAVEAARAGAAGKGFAVVADEVRNLAGKSAEASKNTSALIEHSLRAVERGTRIADATASSLVSVVEDARQVTEQINQISVLSSDQAKSIVRVNEGIEQISSVVQTNSATAQESAAASEELSGQAQVLDRLAKKFQLREE